MKKLEKICLVSVGWVGIIVTILLYYVSISSLWQIF